MKWLAINRFSFSRSFFFAPTSHPEAVAAVASGVCCDCGYKGSRDDDGGGGDGKSRGISWDKDCVCGGETR